MTRLVEFIKCPVCKQRIHNGFKFSCPNCGSEFERDEIGMLTVVKKGVSSKSASKGGAFWFVGL